MKIGLAAALVCLLGASPGLAASSNNERGHHPKLDGTLNTRAKDGRGKSRVILIQRPGSDASAQVKSLGGKPGRRLSAINGLVVELPNRALEALANNANIEFVHWDRPTGGAMNRAAVAVGARAVQQNLGYDGSGIGVAVIDSGITSWHDDLTYEGTSTLVKTAGNQRVAKFVDFVNARTSTYDDNGHGSHVAGIIAGNGRDSRGAHAGIAPGAHLVGLKVLDSHGRGFISDVIAAIDWTIANKAAYNIRVINLSVGAAVKESYKVDPLTLAAKRAVDAGIVLVTAAGNLGRDANGVQQYGGITAPGNAPWVLTVGAYSHEGTVKRTDDVVARYSSRGPTAIDFAAKPDLVAPGTGIVSLSDPTSTMYFSKANYLLNGTVLLGYKPYLSLTGTSMASPVVAGTVALMLEANPNLTPNMVKAVLQYTAQLYDGYDALTQGAGFLNAKGAVDLARFFVTAQAGQRYPHARPWSRTLNWGSHTIRGGVIKPQANAWSTNVIWGSAFDAEGDNIVWGTLCGLDCDNVVWGTLFEEDNIVWGTASSDIDNVVWGTYFDAFDNIVWGTALLGEVDNIVWGTDCEGADCESIVWGSSISTLGELDNIVWGTAELALSVLWNTLGEADNIVWGTSSEEDNITWGNSGEETPLFDDPNAAPLTFDETIFEDIFGFPEIVEPIIEPVTTTITTTTTTLTTTTTTMDTLLGGGGF